MAWYGKPGACYMWRILKCATRYLFNGGGIEGKIILVFHKFRNTRKFFFVMSMICQNVFYDMAFFFHYNQDFTKWTKKSNAVLAKNEKIGAF